MNVPEQMAGYARELAFSVGGKHTVEAWCWVKLTPGQPLEVRCKCVIGSTGDEVASGWGQTPEAAFTACVELWKKTGGDTDPVSSKVRQLQKECALLGYKLIAAEQPKPEPQLASL